MSSPFRTAISGLAHTSRTLAVVFSVAAAGMLPVAAQAQSWSGSLVGTNEVPSNVSPATGFVTMSLSGNILSLSLTWSGLIGGNVTAGHIHCCTAPGSNVGVAVGFNGLPASTSGSYSNTFVLTDLGIYTGTFATNFGAGTAAGSQAALIAGLNSGMAYVNLHNAVFPGGEIRANVTVTPEPASFAILGLGMAAVGFAVRRKRRVV